MSDFPEQIKQAANIFKNESIAYAQVRAEGSVIKLRLQALEVARQFQGDVIYGRDPKGILFYNEQLAFEIPNADFTYQRFGSGALVTIVINFTPTGSGQPPYARFVSRVLSSQLPHLGSGRGKGTWKDFKAGSAQTRAISIAGSVRLNLLHQALRKTVHFNIKDSGRVDMFGILLFKDDSKLVGQTKVVINPDIIFFFALNSTEVIGQFVPAGPIVTGGRDIQGIATWETYDPENSLALETLGLKVEEELQEELAEEGDQAA